METRDLKQRACAAVEVWAGRLWEVALEIHAHPELGYQEQRAAGLLCAVLAEGGLEVRRGIAGMETAFAAGRPGPQPRPSVAILAEYDALPELGHGCGHNLIATAAAGAGLALAAVAAAIPGSAIVFGCPAEESAVDQSGGKIRLLEAGEFAGIDAALMVHPTTQDLVSTRSTLAAAGFEFEFLGKPAHAAAMPHEGINALDGVLQTFAGINALRQHVLPSVRIHGIITHGGASANIVPARAVCRFRVRAEDRVYLQEVVERVLNCARAGALASGSQLRIRQVAPTYEEVLPNAALAGLFRHNLAAAGRQADSEPRHAGMGSTDFGNVSQRLPALSADLAIAPDSVLIHSQDFAAAAASDAARRMMIDGAKALAMTAIDLLCVPEALAAARAAFETARSGRPSAAD
jgi:amidohydrolase